MGTEHREPSTENGRASAIRIDKWLWAARFFKTRALAKAAVEGGKVHVDDTRVKPARTVRVGDRLTITRGTSQWEVVIAAVSHRRGPATVAQALYEETPASMARREAEAERRRAERATAPTSDGRPTKRDRRRLIRFKDVMGED